MSAQRIAVLVSGSGTILEAMIKAGVPIDMVLADKDCRGLKIARGDGIPWQLVDRRRFGYVPTVEGSEPAEWDREGFTIKVADVLRAQGIDLVAMAGFMTIFHEAMFTPETFEGRVLNIHPARLPDFPGEHAVRDTLAAGVPDTVSTIHIATRKLDDATYIVAESDPIPVLADDDVDSLWERIKVEERVLYPWVLQSIIDDSINPAAIYRPV